MTDAHRYLCAVAEVMMPKTETHAGTEQLPRAYALRNTIAETAEKLLREWETAELTLTYLIYLLCKPERRELTKNLIREIRVHPGSETILLSGNGSRIG